MARPTEVDEPHTEGSYSLGVDLGTTFVAAAISHVNGGGTATAEMVTLAPHSVVMPALVFLREDGTLVTGDVARRRAITRPDRLGREFKRRLGDPTPIMLGDQSFDVSELLSALLRDVLAQVNSLEGRAPERVVLTHPANWGPFRRGLFEEVSTKAGLDNAPTITEPEAAAAHYAASRRLHEGQIVAVYDLGGGTFDATVLRGASHGVEILGRPEGIERLGGVDFDQAVLEYVNYSSGGTLDGLDMTDPQTVLALARLRQDCVVAKESLSLDSEAIIPVFLPEKHFEVTLTRHEFEKMIRGPIESTTEALRRTLQSAGVEPSALSAVLLVGGSSRIPLVAEMVSEQLNCRTVVDAHPKYTVALGAATAAYNGAEGGAVGWPAAEASAIAGGSVKGGRAAPTPVPEAPQARPATPTPVPAVTSIPAPTLLSAPAPSTTTPGFVGSAPPGPAPSPRVVSPTPFTPYPPPRVNGATSPPAAPPPTPVPPLPPEAAQPRPARRIRRWIVGAAAALAVLLVLGLVVARVSRPSASSASGPSASRSSAPAAQPAPAPPVVVAPSVPNPTVVGTIPVAAGPEAGAISPDGTYAYVTSTETNSISVINLATNAVVGSIPISAGPPQYVIFTPDGRHAYASVYDEIRNTGNAVVEIDTASRAVTATIPAEKFPYAIAVSPNGRQLYVPNHDVNLVTVVDTTTNAVVQKIAVKPNPHAAAFSGDGRRAYVANHASNVVTVLDTKSGDILSEIPVGKSPHSIAMSPDRSRVYVVNYNGNSVSVIDPVTNTVTATIGVQQLPQSVAFAPDSKHAYVVNDGSNTLSVIDTATNQVTATIPTGQDPTNVFVTQDGKQAYVTNISSNTITVLKTGG
jgi:YVTN family beta-propeller protein